MESKMVERKDIAGLAETLRKQGKKIVTTNGSFDVMHAGHMRYLQKAKEQGDVLIVGLNSDSSIKQNKGENRPIIPQDQRAFMLSSIGFVDYVVIFEETDPRALLSEIKPDVHVNGAEYGGKCIEAETVKKNGGRLVLIERSDDLSTTEIVKRILKVYKE